jgi:hypothetical protein
MNYSETIFPIGWLLGKFIYCKRCAANGIASCADQILIAGHLSRLNLSSSIFVARAREQLNSAHFILLTAREQTPLLT